MHVVTLGAVLLVLPQWLLGCWRAAPASELLLEVLRGGVSAGRSIMVIFACPERYSSLIPDRVYGSHSQKGRTSMRYVTMQQHTIHTRPQPRFMLRSTHMVPRQWHLYKPSHATLPQP